MFYDAETGGMNYKINPLLTAFFAVVDSDYNLIDELYLQVKPREEEADRYVYEKGALDVNGINLDEHFSDPATIYFDEAQAKMVEFFNKHKISGKRRSLQPAGYNILYFDNDFIHEYLMSEDEWKKYVHHAAIDDFPLVNALKRAGLLPAEVGNLTSLVEHFKIPMKEAHHAKGDVLMNIEVHKYLENILKLAKKNSTGNVANNSLLEIIEG